MASELDIINDEDLKAPLELAANYRKLADDFDAVAASMTLMVNKIENQDATIKELTGNTKQLEKEVKRLEAANKKAAKSSESMAAATELADEATGGFISRVKTLGKQLYALALNPVIATIGAIGVALLAVGTYFRSTNEGADKFENILAAIGAVGDFITKKFSALGEQIVKLFEDGNIVGEGFLALLGNIFNRIVGVIDIFTNLFTLINSISLKDLFTGNLKPEDIDAIKKSFIGLGKGAIAVLTGIGSAAEEATKKAEALVSLVEAGRELEDAQRDRILSKAESELKLEKLLFDSKDKTNKKDFERLAALEEYVDVKEQELKIDINLAVRKERLFTAELLQRRGIISTEEESNRVLAQGTTALQDQLLQTKAFGEELTERKQLQADIINLQRNFFAETKKSIQQIAALQKEMDEAAIARATLLRDIRVKALNDQLQASKIVTGREILGVQSAIEQEEQLRKDFGKRLLDDRKARDKAEEEMDKARLEKFKEDQEKRKLIATTAVQAVAMVGDDIFARRQEKLNEEAKHVEELRAKELAAAGDDERRKLAINRKFDREQAKIKTKQAQADKQAAIFGIIINTALGIMKAAPVIPLMIATGVLGAIQLALVASKPIPKFWQGTDNAPDTFIAGERGRELIQHKGTTKLTDGPTLFTGMKGAKVFSNPHTEEILGDISDIGPAINYGSKIRRTAHNDYKIAEGLAENNKWLKKIANKEEAGIVVDEEGFHSYSNRVARRNERINRRFLGA